MNGKETSLKFPQKMLFFFFIFIHSFNERGLESAGAHGHRICEMGLRNRFPKRITLIHLNKTYKQTIL